MSKKDQSLKITHWEGLRFYRNKIKYLSLMALFALLLSIAGSCAAQNKHRKIKSVPCPCEKLDRRLK